MSDVLTSPLIPHQVLVLQRILPPYRLAFFQALACSPKIALTLAYGRASKESALESIPTPPGIETKSVTNTYYGKNELVIVQAGSLPLLRSQQYGTIIAEFNPRIITNILACLYARRQGMKFIWWGHGFRPKSGPFDKWIYRYLASLANALIFYSGAGADELIRQGVPKEKTFVAWNSVNLEEIEHLRRPEPSERRTRILYIGRLIAEKKVALLLRGFAAAAAHLPPKMVLTIIGDGPEQGHLQELAGQLGIAGRVEFVGSLYEQDKLAPFFNTAWVSVSPGYIGLSAIHSLGYGVPMLVADKEPHSPEIVAIEDGINALFFTSDDPKALSNVLLQLAGDPLQQQQLSLASRQTVRKRFSLNGMVQAFEEAVNYAHQ